MGIQSQWMLPIVATVTPHTEPLVVPGAYTNGIGVDPVSGGITTTNTTNTIHPHIFQVILLPPFLFPVVKQMPRFAPCETDHLG